VELGINRAAAPHSTEAYRGKQHSIDSVAQLMRKARDDIELKRWAIDVLAASGCDGRSRTCSIREQATALTKAVRAQTIYVPDGAGVEWVQAAHVTLCLRDVCLPGDDCDSLSVALGGAMLSIGLPAYVVVQTLPGGGQGHVLVGVIDEHGGKFYADAANTMDPVYDRSKAASEVWIDPLAQVGVSGSSGPELVMLGSAEDRQLSRVDGVWAETRYGVGFMHRRGSWQRTPVGLGTILTWHTVHELSDLVAALQFQVDQIDAAYNAAKSAWSAADNAGFLSWETAYNSALTVWVPVRERARAVIVATAATGNDWDWVPTIEITGEDSFDSVAKAFKPFVELDRELRQSAAFPKADLPTYAGTPQPTAPDFDLATYQIADSTMQAIKKAAGSLQAKLEVAAPWLALGAAAIGLTALWYYAPRRAHR